MIPYKQPTFNSTAFNCPHCHAYANQLWSFGFANYGNGTHQIKPVHICLCTHCRAPSLWYSEKLVYPMQQPAPAPNLDLPDNIKVDYEEARAILQNSPRGSAALLRLAIQKLCVHLGEQGKNLNEDIGALVQKGLPEKVQQALDLVRVVGNNAVHPGEMDLKDDNPVATSLFNLVNIIADSMITQPKRVDDMFHQLLPEGARQAIKKRDKV